MNQRMMQDFCVSLSDLISDSARLSEAREENKRLRQENERLHTENARLRRKCADLREIMDWRTETLTPNA